MLPISLPGLPPLSFGASSATSKLDQTGGIFQASGDGDWNVTMGGSVLPGGNVKSLLIAAAVVGAAWFILKKR